MQAAPRAVRATGPRALCVAGHTGPKSHLMGTYEVNAEHSSTERGNVFSIIINAVHLYRATDGKWYIGKAEDMLAAKAEGWIVSSAVSASPLGLNGEEGQSVSATFERVSVASAYRT